ncbi:hypothetical protein ACFV9C_08910 [Kribbella sp. NPDC059898]|uniref:hypothetical protein n=1 Tax=Kribbella sp. NPDC059898 TaxID=3346995 RepID=UPI003653FA16
MIIVIAPPNLLGQPQRGVADYQAEEGHLTLAPGWKWPTAVAYATVGPDGRSMVYQSGFATTQADHYWYCSWETDWLRQRLSRTERVDVRKQLESVRRTHMYVNDIIAVDRPLFDH